MRLNEMSFKPYIIVVSAVAAAVLPGYGSNINLVAVNLLFPLFWGVTFPQFWPQTRLLLLLMLLTTTILLSTVAREAIQGLIYGWQYTSVADTVARYILLYSLGAQFFAALVALAGTVLFKARCRPHVA